MKCGNLVPHRLGRMTERGIAFPPFQQRVFEENRQGFYESPMNRVSNAHQQKRYIVLHRGNAKRHSEREVAIATRSFLVLSHGYNTRSTMSSNSSLRFLRNDGRSNHHHSRVVF